MANLLLTLALLVPHSGADVTDWPTWRGPTGNGKTAAKAVPTTWSSSKNVKWRVALKQPANGSPVVTKEHVFLTTPEDDEGKKRSLYCYDRTNGEQQWVRTVEYGEKMPTHRTNPYCGSTPATDGEHVVVWHASAGLWCYRVNGEEVWHKDLGEFRHIWGYGTSPILHGDRVILHTGPGETSFLAAFDLKTGEEAWRTVEPSHLTEAEIEEKRLAGSWCTPIVHRVGDRDVLICAQPTRVVGYDPSTGSELWSCGGMRAKRGDLTYGSPTIAGDVCLVMGGYVGPIYGVRLDAKAKGDITESHRVFHHPEQLSNCASGVAANGCVFVPDMQGTLWCIDAKTGEANWKERSHRGGTWGSVVEAGGKLYLMGQDGTTVVFEPNAESYEVVAENALGEETNSTPAIVDGEIFLRTHEHLYCIAAKDN